MQQMDRDLLVQELQVEFSDLLSSPSDLPVMSFCPKIQGLEASPFQTRTAYL